MTKGKPTGIRWTDAELALLDNAAAIAGEKRTSYIRRAALSQAKRDIRTDRATV
jgi:uncharacterized protein (DUF1778 family)